MLYIVDTYLLVVRNVAHSRHTLKLLRAVVPVQTDSEIAASNVAEIIRIIPPLQQAGVQSHVAA